jgi:hypothetical protein
MNRLNPEFMLCGYAFALTPEVAVAHGSAVRHLAPEDGAVASRITTFGAVRDSDLVSGPVVNGDPLDMVPGSYLF